VSERTLFSGGVLYPEPGKRVEDGVVLTEGGRVAYAGPNDGFDPERAAGAAEIDLDGRALFPAFCDAHVHLGLGADLLDYMDCTGLDDLDELNTRLRAKAAEPDTRWVLGRGWESRLLFKTGRPALGILDAASPEKPVFLISKDAHSVWVNSAGLRAAEAVGLPKGCVVETHDGRPTGLILEDVEALRRAVVPPPSVEKRAALLRRQAKVFHSHGITAVHNKEGLDGLRFWRQEGPSDSLRVVWNPVFDSVEELRANASAFQEEGDAMLRVGGVKLFLDGSFGSLSAAVSVPYTETGGTGLLAMEKPELELWLDALEELGLHGVFHSIGDRSTARLLDCLRAREWPRGIVHRVEHAQLLSPELEGMPFQGLAFSVQPSHMWGDRDILRRHMDETFREHFAYAFGSMLRKGGVLLFGSDSPVEDIDPWKGIQAAMTRLQGAGEPPWNPAEALSFEQCVAAHTTEPARLFHPGFGIGSLTEGKRADLVVFDGDPGRLAEMDPGRLWGGVRVSMTYLEGRPVYSG